MRCDSLWICCMPRCPAKPLTDGLPDARQGHFVGPDFRGPWEAPEGLRGRPFKAKSHTERHSQAPYQETGKFSHPANWTAAPPCRVAMAFRKISPRARGQTGARRGSIGPRAPLGTPADVQ